MAIPYVDAMTQDIRSALRRLWRTPAIPAIVILSLALGIGANTAIFTLARWVFATRTPYQSPERVALLDIYQSGVRTRVTEGQAVVVQRLARSLERVEASAIERVNWRRGDSTLQLMSQVVTPGLPSAMHMVTLVGRSFAGDEGQRGHDDVVMLSEGLWRREFAGSLDVVGKTLVLGIVPRTVVGVSTRPESGPDVDVWVPRALEFAGDWFPTVVAWLRPGVSLEHANIELATLSSELVSDRFGRLEARLSRPGARDKQSSLDQTMIVLWGASAFVLAIVCANLANLLLARNLAGEREMAIRAALGASRLGIIRLLMAESTLLAVAGGLGGTLIATWGTAALLALRPRSLSLVYPDHVALDATIVAYSLGLSIATGLVVGAAPALRASRPDPLRGVGRDSLHVQRWLSARWLFGGALALQAALAFVLLVGAALLMNSYVRLQRVAAGFEVDHLVQMAVRLDTSVHVGAGARREFFQHLAERVAALGGVQDAAVATDAPPHGTMMMGAIDLDGRPSESLPPIEVSWIHVTPNYFRVLRIPRVEGRVLTDTDGRDGEVVVSQSFAARYWSRDRAIGRRFRVHQEKGWGPWMQVVGVVGDVTGRGLRDDQDEVYLPYATNRAERGAIVARVDGEPSRFFQAMKAQAWALNPDVPIAEIRTVRQGLAGSIDEQPFYATLLGTLALIALALAAVGVFGVASYATSQRKREIGIRVAMGAQAGAVERLILRQGLVPPLAGILAGVAGAFALASVMRSLVYGVSVTDPAIYLSTAVALVVVSLVATWIPARRASRADPMFVLRGD